MKPIEFEDKSKSEKSGEEICLIIKNASQWSEYHAYGILPGIEKAEYKIKTANMIGSQFVVTNTDGSNHIEEIIDWADGETLTVKMHEFVFPLNKLATHFTEVFAFTPQAHTLRLVVILECIHEMLCLVLYFGLFHCFSEKLLQGGTLYR